MLASVYEIILECFCSFVASEIESASDVTMDNAVQRTANPPTEDQEAVAANQPAIMPAINLAVGSPESPPDLANSVEDRTQKDGNSLPIAATESSPVASCSKFSLTFEDLMPFPKRVRPSKTCQRKKPPSLEFTSKETIAFVRDADELSKNKQLKKLAKASKGNKGNIQVKRAACNGGIKGQQQNTQRRSDKSKKVNNDHTECSFCHQRYGDDIDPKKGEEWLSCAVCSIWYHASCAEAFGVLDDEDGFICANCMK